jgi:hypothetical protein
LIQLSLLHARLQAPASNEPEEDLPPWVLREKERKLQAELPSALVPWPLYLMLSLFTAIASVSCAPPRPARDVVSCALQLSDRHRVCARCRQHASPRCSACLPTYHALHTTHTTVHDHPGFPL